MPDLTNCVGIYATPVINKQYFVGEPRGCLRFKVNFYGFTLKQLMFSKVIEKEMCAIYVTMNGKKWSI